MYLPLLAALFPSSLLTPIPLTHIQGSSLSPLLSFPSHTSSHLTERPRLSQNLLSLLWASGDYMGLYLLHRLRKTLRNTRLGLFMLQHWKWKYNLTDFILTNEQEKLLWLECVIKGGRWASSNHGGNWKGNPDFALGKANGRKERVRVAGLFKGSQSSVYLPVMAFLRRTSLPWSSYKYSNHMVTTNEITSTWSC